MNLLKYFTAAYLFTAPVQLQRSDKIFMGIAAALVIAAIILKIARRATKNQLLRGLLDKWFSLALTIGILGLLWSGLRYQDIQILSAHIVVMVLYIIAVVWAIAILGYTFGKYQAESEEYRQLQLRNKYL